MLPLSERKATERSWPSSLLHMLKDLKARIMLLYPNLLVNNKQGNTDFNQNPITVYFTSGNTDTVQRKCFG